ncbi:MAG: hypothetical protein KA764_12535 [Anaerolineales bacterium]|nr:hypothetical protein [Anaerolineales bacterium]
MRSAVLLLLSAIVLSGCQATPPAAATPAATAAPAPTLAAPPTATALAEGLSTRLGTPDPSPACPDHYPWFFENRARECAATLLNTWAVLQPFEGGVMVWLQEGGRTLILVDDGSPFKPYYTVTDPGSADLPGPDPNLVPPAGRYQPVLGFARFWNGLAPDSAWVREQLGWAIAPEAGYSAFWQCNTAAGDAARCYLTGPRDEILVFARGAAAYWTYWQGPAR